MKSYLEYHRTLQRKYAWARNAARWCRMKATTCHDKALSIIYADIANEADAEARKIWRMLDANYERYWNERFGADTTPQEAWDMIRGVSKKGAF